MMLPEVLLKPRSSVPIYVIQTWREQMNARDPKLTYEEVAAKLAYDQSTGEFRWKATGNNRTKPGDLAGHVGELGYRRITITSGGRMKRIMAHRLAWLLVHREWPAKHIDHIDGNPTNNAIANLRLATLSENKINSRTYSNNKSGHKGVGFMSDPRRRLKPWVVQIGINGRQTTVGYYRTIEEAVAARKAAALILHGKFTRK
jgi:hypothetical protein